MLDIETPHGPARLHPAPLGDQRGLVVLTHSAGGGVDDPALLAAVLGAAEAGLGVVLVELPYRLAGGRPLGPVPADAVWTAVVRHVAAANPGLPVVTGGRSYGGRAACRTAAPTGATGVAGVLCLAFPLQPAYGGATASRLPELEAAASAGVPVLVVQGDRDTFGLPPAGPGREVVVVPGDHSLRSSLPLVTATVARWLGELVGSWSHPRQRR